MNAEVMSAPPAAVDAPNAPATENKSIKSGKVLVRNVGNETSVASLVNMLEQAGEIVSLDLRFTKRGGSQTIKTQAMFKRPSEAATAVESLDGKELDGNKINIIQYIPKKERDARSKSGDTVGEQDSQMATNQANENATLVSKEVKKKHPTAHKTRPRLAKGEPSDTMLYVSHLAYSVDDNALMELFAPYNVKSANVVYNRYRPKQSRGFAFVDFHTHDDQQRAMAEKNGLELSGRVLNVTVALQEQQSQSDKPKQDASQDATASSTADATPATESANTEP